MTKTALFFGSFNPIHMAHLMLAQYVLNFGNVSELWFVVSPHNPFKRQADLAPAEDRVRMVELATEADENMRVCDVELRLPVPSFTVRTLEELERLYPEREFVLVMGGDNLGGLPKWREAEIVVGGREIIVYPRPGQEVDAQEVEDMGGRVTILEAPQMDVSSTMIREWIKRGVGIRHFVSREVEDYIEEKGLYRTE